MSYHESIVTRNGNTPSVFWDYDECNYCSMLQDFWAKCSLSFFINIAKLTLSNHFIVNVISKYEVTFVTLTMGKMHVALSSVIIVCSCIDKNFHDCRVTFYSGDWKIVKMVNIWKFKSTWLHCITFFIGIFNSQTRYNRFRDILDLDILTEIWIIG